MDNRLIFLALFGATVVLMSLALGLPAILRELRQLRFPEATHRRTVMSDEHDRLVRLEHGMEAMAIELERIGESQRFLTKVLAGGSSGIGGTSPYGNASGNRSDPNRVSLGGSRQLGLEQEVR